MNELLTVLYEIGTNFDKVFDKNTIEFDILNKKEEEKKNKPIKYTEPNISIMNEEDYKKLFEGKTFFFIKDKLQSSVINYYFFHEKKPFVVKFVLINNITEISFKWHTEPNLFLNYKNFIENYKSIVYGKYSFEAVSHENSINFWKKLLATIEDYSNKNNINTFKYIGFALEKNDISKKTILESDKLKRQFVALFRLFNYKLAGKENIIIEDINNILDKKIINIKQNIKEFPIFRHKEKLNEIKDILGSIPETLNIITKQSKKLKNNDLIKDILLNNNKALKFLNTLDDLKKNIENNKNFLLDYYNYSPNIFFKNLKEYSNAITIQLSNDVFGEYKSENYNIISGFMSNFLNADSILSLTTLYEKICILKIFLLFKKAINNKKLQRNLYKNLLFLYNEILSKYKIMNYENYIEYEIITFLKLIKSNEYKKTTNIDIKKALNFSIKKIIKKYPNYFELSTDFNSKVGTVASNLLPKISQNEMPKSELELFFPYESSKTTDLEFEERPGSLYVLKEKAKMLLFNKREKMYYLALKKYGIPEENIKYSKGYLVFNIEKRIIK